MRKLAFFILTVAFCVGCYAKREDKSDPKNFGDSKSPTGAELKAIMAKGSSGTSTKPSTPSK